MGTYKVNYFFILLLTRTQRHVLSLRKITKVHSCYEDKQIENRGVFTPLPRHGTDAPAMETGTRRTRRNGSPSSRFRQRGQTLFDKGLQLNQPFDERQVRYPKGVVYYRGFLKGSPLFLLSLQKEICCHDYSGTPHIKSRIKDLCRQYVWRHD